MTKTKRQTKTRTTTLSDVCKYVQLIEAGQEGNGGKLAITLKTKSTTDRQQFGNGGGGVCRWWSSMQSGVICGAGRLQWLGIGGRLVLHTLRSGYVPCLLAHWPPPPVRGGEEAEKALIISIDCASSRARDTAASGQHRPRGCPPIILKTHRQPFQKYHTPAPDNSGIDCCQELPTEVSFLSEVALDAA